MRDIGIIKNKNYGKKNQRHNQEIDGFQYLFDSFFLKLYNKQFDDSQNRDSQERNRSKAQLKKKSLVAILVGTVCFRNEKGSQLHHKKKSNI